MIEDNLDVRENLEEILQLSGYDVQGAKDGKEGVNMAKQWQPDLILCDIMLPVLDGFGILQILSKDPFLQNIPFIFLTAKTELGDIRKGMNLGADDYITKPFQKDELLSVVEMRLRKSENSASGPKQESQLKNLKRSHELLTKVFDKGDLRSYPEDYDFFSKGDRPRNVFLIQSGIAKGYRPHPVGRDFIFGLFTSGTFPGLWEAYHQVEYTNNCTTLTQCETLIVPLNVFAEELKKEADIGLYIKEIHHRQKLALEEKIIAVAYHSVRKRVALVLKELHDLGLGSSESSIELGRVELAAMCGSAKETITRTLSDFKDEGLIDIKSGRIVILDAHAISNMPD